MGTGDGEGVKGVLMWAIQRPDGTLCEWTLAEFSAYGKEESWQLIESASTRYQLKRKGYRAVRVRVIVEDEQ